MRKLLALIAVGAAGLVAGPVAAADMPLYPEPYIEIPDVDYGMGGNFYLRGSIAGNLWWAKETKFICDCGPTGSPVTEGGYGYSIGAGFGYETGDGLRADVTVDHIVNSGVSYPYTYTDGDDSYTDLYTVALRSTLVLANAYYDFPLSGLSGGGGFGAYVGAGLGFAHTHVTETGVATGPADATPQAPGSAWTAAGAVMAGVTYDMGNLVADLGYRGIYMPQITNGEGMYDYDPAWYPRPLHINNNFIHELRGTVRYRLR